jgi:hercynylcysteine S-oxide lyase
VFVANATVAVNTVLRNLVWNRDGKDEILYFSSVYGACGKTVDYMVDSNDGKVSSREIILAYPCDDEEIVDAFKIAVEKCQSDGKRARICMFDTVSSLPGVRFPFEDITKACRQLGVLSLIDGAQGIGQIKIDLEAVDPDFFTTNCHKWLHVPRSCAVFYVPLRNQDLISSTVPTSHGYVAKTGTRFNPLPPPEKDKSAFVHNFEFFGTLDTSAFLCVKDAIAWRAEVLGGEDRIMQYTQWLAAEGGRRAAAILGTKIMENSKGSLTKCAMVNVALPMWVRPAPGAQDSPVAFAPEADHIVLPFEEALAVGQWILHVLMDDYNTFVALFLHQSRVWVRLSAQVYLGVDDFEWVAGALREVCKRFARENPEKRHLILE